MPAALLALLMLVATVDPRLVEPLRLLAEVGARESLDDHAGQFYADLPEALNLTLAVGQIPHGAVGRYDVRTRTVTVAESVLADDPRVVAVVLVHELQHALDRQRAALDLLDVDCVTREIRGFEAQAQVTRLFWPDELPNRTCFERRIVGVVRVTEGIGAAGLHI